MKVVKIRASDECISSFLEVPVSYGQAEGELRGDVPQLMLSETTPVASVCVAHLKSAPQAEAPGQINRLFAQTLGLLSV